MEQPKRRGVLEDVEQTRQPLYAKAHIRATAWERLEYECGKRMGFRAQWVPARADGGCPNTQHIG